MHARLTAQTTFANVFTGQQTRTAEPTVGEINFGELCERCNVVRDRAAELVAAEIELLERRRKWRQQPQRLGERRPCVSRMLFKRLR